MSLVRLELVNFLAAPWGLFTETIPPQPKIWLTVNQPLIEIDSSFLSYRDLASIEHAVRYGILNQRGLELQDQELVEVKEIDQTEVAKLVQQEISLRKDIKRRPIEEAYPEILFFMSQHHNKIKKEIRERARNGVSLSFFEACRAFETKRVPNPRESVLELIDEVIKIKVKEISEDHGYNRQTGSSFLADAYFNLIEESEESEEED